MRFLLCRLKLPRTIYWFLLLLLVNVFVCYVFYFYQTMRILQDITWISFSNDAYDKYLVNNSKCRIPDLNPWNPVAMRFYKKKEYKDCSTKPLLTEIFKKEGRAFLLVNKKAKTHYCLREISCCYSNVTRDEQAPVPDNNITLSPCLYFNDLIELFNDVVLVKCYCGTYIWSGEIYRNTHATTFTTEEFKKRKLKFHDSRPPNVLIVGVDSISRLNFYRTLPSTAQYFKSKNWTSYNAYNKVELNTFPNLIALLTGRSFDAAVNVSDAHDNFIDGYDIIWNHYKRLGYVTAYAEDMAEINTFNFLKKGFRKKPTDFYFRHYSLATEELLSTEWDNGEISCAGPEVYATKILNIARDFTATFRDQPNFCFLWMNSFSHDDLNAPFKMDGVLVEFFRDLEAKGIMNDTIVIFLSDHGYRFGNFRLTSAGVLEDRLPALHFHLPENFIAEHPREYKNFQENRHRLTSPFDLYMTLQDFLVLSGLKYNIKPSVSCPKCKSLFEQTEEIRSCQDAAISMSWCMCITYRDISTTSALISNITAFVIWEVQNIVFTTSGTISKCALLKPSRILRASISEKYENGTYATVMFETEPRLTLEATVRLDTHGSSTKFFVEGRVNRVDLYKFTSSCVNTETLKKYCYCKSHLSFLAWMSSWFDL